MNRPSGRARFLVDFSQGEGRQRRVFGRLEDHGIAGSERWSGLPACTLNRIIPCADADANAQSLAARVGIGSAKLDHLAIEPGYDAAVEFQRIGSGCGIGNQRFLNSLAGIERFEFSDFGIAGTQDIGGAAQDTAAFHRLQCSPGRLRGGGGLHRLLDQRRCRAKEPGDDFARCRIDYIKRLAVLVLDEAAIDEMRCLGLRAHVCSPGF